MKIVVQIYEVQNPSEAETLIALGVDHIGSVVVSQEKRYVPSIRETVRLTDRLGARSSIIPLFSDADAISSLLDYYSPHILHFCEAIDVRQNLHGCRRLVHLQETIRNRFPGIKLIRSIPIRSFGAFDAVPSLEIAEIFEPVSDLFLTDTLLGGQIDQPVSGFVGITGKQCEWDIAEALVKKSRIPVILGGGLSPENVREGILKVRPAGVDSCTLTNALDDEGQPIRFRKDVGLVKRFVREVRNAENEL
ncbi:MAG: hypothetical protein C4530_08645 [Desulfobacteraceae bacterium]|nr:MAG: hypothetical protein C4530_08645 [Desulfobacteraceae bacterium]